MVLDDPGLYVHEKYWARISKQKHRPGLLIQFVPKLGGGMHAKQRRYSNLSWNILKLQNRSSLKEKSKNTALLSLQSLFFCLKNE